MLYVRNPTGVSHSPEEWARPEDCHAGVLALADVLQDLLARPVREGDR
jgi:N-carbamoyl-L-amino-acid hydrolase